MRSDLQVSRIDVKWNVNLPIYASEAFLKTESDDFGWVGGTDDLGRLRCLLPYTVLRKGGIRMIRFRTAVIPLERDLLVSEEKSFLNNVVHHFRLSGADMILPSGNSAIFRTYPDNAVAAPYGTFINSLDKCEQVLCAEIRRTYRHNIRKAQEVGIEVKCGPEYLDMSYQLCADTMKRSGASFKNYNDFERRLSGLGDSLRIFVAMHNGQPQSCLVSPFSQHTAYNCYAGSVAQPLLGATHLLYWEAMKYFRSLNVRFFDFQGVRINPGKGTKQEGIATFKRGFGGTLFEGYLWKYALRPLRSAVYALGVRLLMGGDFVDHESRRLATN